MNTKLRHLATVVAVVGAIASGAGAALAAPGAPYDGGTVGTAQASAQILQTSLFGLGADLSLIGVDPSVLAAVGPQSSTSTPSGGMLIVDDDMLDCPNAQFQTIQSAVA